MKVSAREKKILYAGAVIAAAIMIYHAATLFSPGDGEGLAEKVGTQESLLGRQRDLIGREDSYKKRIEDAENDLAKIRTRLLSENNAVAAGTELQRILRDLAEHTGSVITQTSNLPERKIADGDSLIKISVRIAIDCTTENLVDFLIAIKNYDKFLKVEEMTINTTLSQKQYVVRRPLSLVIAGYIGAPPPEPEAKPGENTAQAKTAQARQTFRSRVRVRE